MNEESKKESEKDLEQDLKHANEMPMSEKDEVKEAEERTRKAQKKADKSKLSGH